MKDNDPSMELLDSTWSDDFLQSILHGDPVSVTDNVDLEDVFSLPVTNFDQLKNEIQIDTDFDDSTISPLETDTDPAPSSAASDSGLSSEESEQIQLQEILLDDTTEFVWEEECSTSSCSSPLQQQHIDLTHLTTTNRPLAVRVFRVPVSSIQGHHPQLVQKKVVTSMLRPSPTSSPIITTTDDGTLELTEEEIRLFSKEGMVPPSHYPLNRTEERDLKRIRRKIRNKISAQDSRRRKREYMEGLENRVKASEHESTHLRKRLRLLETKNASLISQLRYLQETLSKKTTAATTTGTKATQGATCLLVMLLSLALFFGPNSLRPTIENDGEMPSPLDSMPMTSGAIRGPSRSLLSHPLPGVAKSPVIKQERQMMLDDHDYIMQHCQQIMTDAEGVVDQRVTEPMDCTFWSSPEPSARPTRFEQRNLSVGNMIAPPLDD